MKNLFFPFILLSIFLLGCQPTAKKPQTAAHVVVIGIDGMSSQGFIDASTPTMDSLIAIGAFKFNVRAVMPSSSTSNWNAMLCGVGPEISGVTSNDWEPGQYSFPPVVMTKNKYFPSIFNIIREQMPQAELGSIYHWSGFGRMIEAGVANESKTYKTALETAQKTAEYIAAKKPALTFIQLDHVDAAGHKHGHMTPGYLAAITNADSLVRIIINGIKKAGITDNTMVMVVSDHGGIGYGHGGETYEEMTVPAIFCGKGIKKGYKIEQQVYQYDVAASIAFSLGVTAPYAWTGRPTQSAFIGFDEPANLWKGLSALPAPVIHPEAHLYSPAGGLYLDQPAEVIISLQKGTSGTIRYTIDGSEPTAQSTVYEKPFSLTTSTVVQAKAFGDNSESLTAKAYFRVASAKGDNGVNFTFYRGADMNQLPNFGQMKPLGQGVIPEFRIDAPALQELFGDNMKQIAVRMTAWLQIDTDGKYNFYTNSDDGSKLYIGDKCIVDNDGDHGMTRKKGNISLTKGRHPIRVEYLNADGSGWIDAYYEGPGIPYQIIPADKLFKK